MRLMPWAIRATLTIAPNPDYELAEILGSRRSFMKYVFKTQKTKIEDLHIDPVVTKNIELKFIWLQRRWQYREASEERHRLRKQIEREELLKQMKRRKEEDEAEALRKNSWNWDNSWDSNSSWRNNSWDWDNSWHC